MDGLQSQTPAIPSEERPAACDMAALHRKLGIQGCYFVVAGDAGDRVAALAKRLSAKRCHVFRHEDGSLTVALWEASDAPRFRRLFGRAIVHTDIVVPRDPVPEMPLCGEAPLAAARAI
jgi:hypothetical protein